MEMMTATVVENTHTQSELIREREKECNYKYIFITAIVMHQEYFYIYSVLASNVGKKNVRDFVSCKFRVFLHQKYYTQAAKLHVICVRVCETTNLPFPPALNL